MRNKGDQILQHKHGKNHMDFFMLILVTAISHSNLNTKCNSIVYFFKAAKNQGKELQFLTQSASVETFLSISSMQSLLRATTISSE